MDVAKVARVLRRLPELGVITVVEFEAVDSTFHNPFIPDYSMKHTKRLVVENALGLHARPAAELARVAQAFQAAIVFSGNGKSASAKSVLSLLLLGAVGGTELTVTADGVDAADALLAIKQTGHLSQTNP